MMEEIRAWLLGLTAVAMLSVCAQALIPEGSVREVGKLICGLLLFLAATEPLTSWSPPFWSELTEGWAELKAEETLSEEPWQARYSYAVIERETEAYIQKKKEELGLMGEIQVEWSRTEEIPRPIQGRVAGADSPEMEERQMDFLKEHFGLTEEQILRVNDG